MAKEVKSFPKAKRGRPIKYDYDRMFNGKKWAFTEGVDFTVAPNSFKAAIYARKTLLGHVIKTSTVVDEKTGVATVYVQRLFGAAAKAHLANPSRPGRRPKVAA